MKNDVIEEKVPTWKDVFGVDRVEKGTRVECICTLLTVAFFYLLNDEVEDTYTSKLASVLRAVL